MVRVGREYAFSVGLVVDIEQEGSDASHGSSLQISPAFMAPLERVQHRALLAIGGAFWDSQEEALQILTYVPNLESTIRKLYRSAVVSAPSGWATITLHDGAPNRLVNLYRGRGGTPNLEGLR